MDKASITLKTPLSVELTKAIRDAVRVKSLMREYEVILVRQDVETEVKNGDTEKSLFNRFMEKKREIRDKEFGLET